MGFAQIQLTNGPMISRPTLELDVSAKQSFEIQLTGKEGELVDLTDYDVSDNGPAVSTPHQARPLPITTGVQFLASEYQGQAFPSVSLTAAILSAAEGLIRVDFTQASFTKPGVYLAEIDLIKDGELEEVYRMYVDAQAPLTWAVNGPITISEVRLWARDSLPEDNFLLDEVEFKDSEITAAIRRAVDIWNSTNPMLRRYTFTAANFPFRSQWLDLTIALLYEIAARSYLRNHLSYSAAGLQVDDKNKFSPYIELAKSARQEFTEWAKNMKLQLNAQQCWGSSKVGFTGGINTYADYFAQ